MIPHIIYGFEWNDRPVMCAEKDETFFAINSKNEELVFSGTILSKVRDGKGGLKDIPAKLPFSFYANAITGTYTALEYHESYKTYCVVAYGENFQVFLGGVQ